MLSAHTARERRQEKQVLVDIFRSAKGKAKGIIGD
jgi:hypothetical protein